MGIYNSSAKASQGVEKPSEIRFFDESITDHLYRIIDYQIEKKKITVIPCTFEELFPIFNKMVDERIKNYKE